MVYFLPILIFVDITKYIHYIQKYPSNDLKKYKFKALQDEFVIYNEKIMLLYQSCKLHTNLLIIHYN